MENGPTPTQGPLGDLSTSGAGDEALVAFAAASVTQVDAAFGRRLDSWLSLYRLAMAGCGFFLTVLLFSSTPWPLYAACYLALSAAVMPFLRLARTEERQRYVRATILLADIGIVSLFVFIWGTRASPAVFMYVPIIVGWTLVPQVGLGRLSLLLALASLAALLVARPEDWVVIDGMRLDAGSTPMASSAGSLMFFGLVASSLIAVHALLNFTVARLREHSMAVSRLLAERSTRLREAEWARQLKEAERLEAIGRLAGGVAHDFNNLLTALLGCAEVAERYLATNPEVAKAQLRAIRQAAERGSGLTAQLLDFASRRSTKPEEIDLPQRVTDTVQLLRRLIKDSVAIVVQTEDTPCGVCLDPSGLERLLLNLAVNAADAMPQGGKLTIRISKRRDRHAEVAVLEVQDQGVGIDAEDLPHIFEPFFTRKTRGKGTGLGLASVYGIVKQSLGEIFVESPPEGGTLFRITWPLIALTSPKVTQAVEDHAGEHGRVLVVDDDKGVRDVATEHLRAVGYDVWSVASGAEALRELENHRDEVDVLLTDVSMPGMSGFELAAEVRGLIPGLPVLFMSGYAEEFRGDPLMLRDVHVLPKPFSSEQLVSEVRALLERARTDNVASGKRCPGRSP